MSGKSRRPSAPFARSDLVTVVLPSTPASPSESDKRSLDLFRQLIVSERFEFEIELGAPIQFSSNVPESGAALLIGPSTSNPAFSRLGLEPAAVPTAYRDVARQLLVVDGPDLPSVAESLSLMRTLSIAGDQQVVASDCQSVSEAIERIEQEVRFTYPGFDLRGLDWDKICQRHRPLVDNDTDTFSALQRWIAELCDMHTWVQPSAPHGLLPYAVHVSPDAAEFVRVPDWTSAWKAGVRPGDRLVDVDTDDILSQTGGPAHMLPYLAGRRLLSGPAGIARTLSVTKPDGQRLSFDDTPGYTPWREPVEWSRLASGTGYLKLWGFPVGVNDAVDAALGELGTCERLIVDLRGNSGGLLVEALDFRDRFVPHPTQLGSIRFSTPGGDLSRSEPIHAEPATRYRRWNRPVRFLVDPLTASASEDAILGLNTLPDVKFVGTNTAGGSGRPRSIRLLPGMRLSVSTALTYDPSGRCVEGFGIIPDIRLPGPAEISGEHGLGVADRSW